MKKFGYNASNISKFCCPHEPMMYGLRHSMRDADLSALNERQAHLRSIMADLPFEAAVAELLLSSVRHAVGHISEDELGDALAAIAVEIKYGDYRFLDLYAMIAAAIKTETYDNL